MPRKRLNATLSLDAKVSRDMGKAFGSVQKNISNITKSQRDFLSTQKRLTAAREHWDKQGKSTRRFDSALKSVNSQMLKQERILNNLKKGSERLAKVRRNLSKLKIPALAAAAGVAGLGVAAGRKVVGLSGQFTQLRKEGVSKAALSKQVIPDALAFSKQFGFDVADVLDAFTQLKKAGYSTTRAVSSLPNILELAKAESLEIADAFQLANVTSQAMQKPIKNLTKELNMVSGLTSITDLTGLQAGKALGGLGAMATLGKSSMRETVLVAAALKNYNTNLTGDEIKTRLEELPKALRNMADATKWTKDSAKEYKILGITAEDFWTKNQYGERVIKSVSEAVGVLANRYKELGIRGDEMAVSMGRLFTGEQEVEIMNALTRNIMSGKWAENQRKLAEQLTITEKATIASESLGAAIDSIPQAFSRAVLKVSTGFSDAQEGANTFFRSIGGMIENVGEKIYANRQRINEVFTHLLDVGARLKPTFEAVFNVFSRGIDLFLKIPPNVWGWVATGTAAIIGLKLAISGTTTAFNLFTGTSALLHGKFMAFTTILPKLGPAIASAFAAIGPAGWVTLGVAALAGGAFLIYKNWTPIKGFFAQLWDDVKSIFTDFYNWVDNKPVKVKAEMDSDWHNRPLGRALRGAGAALRNKDKGLFGMVGGAIFGSTDLGKKPTFDGGISPVSAGGKRSMSFNREIQGFNAMANLSQVDMRKKSAGAVSSNYLPKLVAAEIGNMVVPEARELKSAILDNTSKLVEITDRPGGVDTVAIRAKRWAGIQQQTDLRFLGENFKNTMSNLSNDFVFMKSSSERMIDSIDKVTEAVKSTAKNVIGGALDRLTATILSDLYGWTHDKFYQMINPKGSGKGIDEIVLGGRKASSVTSTGNLTTQKGIVNLGTSAGTWFGGTSRFTQAEKDKLAQDQLGGWKTLGYFAASVAGAASLPFAAPALGAAGKGLGALGLTSEVVKDWGKEQGKAAITEMAAGMAEGTAMGAYDRITKNENVFNITIEGEDDEERVRKMMQAINDELDNQSVGDFLE